MEVSLTVHGLFPVATRFFFQYGWWEGQKPRALLLPSSIKCWLAGEFISKNGLAKVKYDKEKGIHNMGLKPDTV